VEPSSDGRVEASHVRNITTHTHSTRHDACLGTRVSTHAIIQRTFGREVEYLAVSGLRVLLCGLDVGDPDLNTGDVIDVTRQ